MKKISKFLGLMFVSVCLLTLFAPLNVFALQNDDSMKVIAHIEAPAESGMLSAYLTLKALTDITPIHSRLRAEPSR